MVAAYDWTTKRRWANMFKIWKSQLLSSQMRQADAGLWWFSAAANVLMLAAPLYMTQVYSRVLPSHGLETLFFLTLIVLAAQALHGTVETVRSLIAHKLGARYELTASAFLLDGGIAAPRAGQVAEAMRDTALVRQALTSKLYLTLFDLPFVPLFLAAAFLCHPLIGLVTTAGGALLLLLAWLNNAGLGDSSERAGAHQANAARYASAALDASEAARAMGMGRALLLRWESEALRAAAVADDAGTLNAAYFGLTRFVRQALQTLVLGLGAYLVLTGQMHAGLLFAASLIAGRALQPVEQMIGGWRQMQTSLEANRRVEQMLEALASTQSADPLPLPAIAGRLDLRGASVTAEGPRGPVTLIEDISLSVRPGEIVAVMGPSGSGKSTLARLLAGVTGTDGGEVRLDGFELHNWPHEQRGRAIGYLGQDPGLLAGTVAENIARFDPDADALEIVAAAQRAQAHDFIAQLPDGYATRIGAGGVRLSGGQAQRIGLARAFFGDPPVLILDEPNAHLDAEGERALNQALAESRLRECAVVVISQRQGILQIADRVVLMRGGRIETSRTISGLRGTPLAAVPASSASVAQAS